jgi:acyl-CoA synthetase (AMP-forming)/AMP-acid ligase II
MNMKQTSGRDTHFPHIAGTVHQAFRQSATRYSQSDFLSVLPETAAKYQIEPRAYSYADAAVEVAKLEALYRAADLGHGHRVGLMLENRPAMFFHWLALNALGVSVVPINPEWRSAELEYLIGHSELCVAVVPSARLSDAALVARSTGCEVVVTSPDLSGLARVPRPAPLTARVPDNNTECALLYTSGTTSRPKGCVLPNEYFLWAGTWYAEAGGLHQLARGSERLVTPLPTSHMNTLAYSTMAMLLTGGCIVPLDRFHPSSWWKSVYTARATIVHYLGVMPAMLLEAPPDTRDSDHCVRFGFGAGISPRLHAQFERRFGFPLLEAWAMTETGAGAVIIANQEPRKVGTACFGRAQPGNEYRVVDEHSEDVAPGQPGELLIRRAGPKPRFGFFREYLKDPEATATAWEGGYFRTGDIVQVDADGDFHFIDRKKNLIRRSGENISAVEVESVMLQHPGVAAVGVSAVPDEVRGDEVMACVVPRVAVSATYRDAFAREVLDFCLQRLAYFKAPGYIVLCKELPLTPTEKIQRARLKELAQGMLSGPACIDLRALKKRTRTV